MIAWIVPLLLFAAPAMAQIHSCSEPLQYCSSVDGGNVYIESCSVTCPDGVKAICAQGELIEVAGKPTCSVKSENQCYCASDIRRVQTLGDHE